MRGNPLAALNEPLVASMSSAEQYGKLFLALAEELKLPLQYIARQAELQSLRTPIESLDNSVESGPRTSSIVAEQSNGADCLRRIQTSADMTLQLLDSYLLSMRLSLEPAAQLSLEPVSVSAVLYETAAQLQATAKRYGVTVRLHVQGRYEPVMAHRQALQAALISLGYALIEALPAAGGSCDIQLATHRTKQGIVAGVYGELDNLTPGMFARAKQLQGSVRQPMVGTLAGSGAGVFVADTLLGAMASRLRVGRFQKVPGFAVTLPASEQLQFI